MNVIFVEMLCTAKVEKQNIFQTKKQMNFIAGFMSDINHDLQNLVINNIRPLGTSHLKQTSTKFP